MFRREVYNLYTCHLKQCKKAESRFYRSSCLLEITSLEKTYQASLMPT